MPPLGQPVLSKTVDARQKHVVRSGTAFLGHQRRLEAPCVSMARQGQLGQPAFILEGSHGDNIEHSAVGIGTKPQHFWSADDIHPRHPLLRKKNAMALSPSLTFHAGIQKQRGHAQAGQTAKDRPQHAWPGGHQMHPSHRPKRLDAGRSRHGIQGLDIQRSDVRQSGLTPLNQGALHHSSVQLLGFRTQNHDHPMRRDGQQPLLILKAQMGHHQPRFNSIAHVGKHKLAHSIGQGQRLSQHAMRCGHGVSLHVLHHT